MSKNGEISEVCREGIGAPNLPEGTYADPLKSSVSGGNTGP